MIELENRVLTTNRKLLKAGSGIRFYKTMENAYFRNVITDLSRTTEFHIKSAYQENYPSLYRHGPAIGYLAYEASIDSLTKLYALIKNDNRIPAPEEEPEDEDFVDILDYRENFWDFEENSRRVFDETRPTLDIMWEESPNAYKAIMKIQKVGVESFQKECRAIPPVNIAASWIPGMLEDDLSSSLVNLYLEVEKAVYGKLPISLSRSLQDFWVCQ